MTDSTKGPQKANLTGRPSVSFRVIEGLLSDIGDGTFSPGQKLPAESYLMERFGVGRSALREAIKILEYFGFVVIRRGTGTFIQDSCTPRLMFPLLLSLIWVKSTPHDQVSFSLAIRLIYLHLGLDHLDEEGWARLRDVQQQFEELTDRLAADLPPAPRILPVYEDLLAQRRDIIIDDPMLSNLLWTAWNVYHLSAWDYHAFFRSEQDWLDMFAMDRREGEVLALRSHEALTAYVTERGHLWERLVGDRKHIPCRPIRTIVQPDVGRDRTIPQQIFSQIALDIINGVYAPGSRLPTEEACMERFGVSRNAVREATKALGAIGLIEVRRALGTFVPQHNDGISPFADRRAYGRILFHDDAKDFLRMKVCIRGAMMYLAMLHATDAELRGYAALCRRFADALTAPAGDQARASALLTELNERLNELHHNPILHQVETIVLHLASASCAMSVTQTFAQGRNAKVAASYLRDAEILLARDDALVAPHMAKKLQLWIELET